MSDTETSTVDLTVVDEVEKMVRMTAQMICAEQPDVPEPQGLQDLDSFSMVQVLLELENITGLKLLERFEDFREGDQFRDLATFIVKVAAEPELPLTAEAAGAPEAAEAPGDAPAVVDTAGTRRPSQPPPRRSNSFFSKSPGPGGRQPWAHFGRRREPFIYHL